MFFVNYTTEEWVLKHPELEILQGVCDGCGQSIKADLPFVAKDYVGLRAADCPCGLGKHTVMSLKTSSSKKNSEWAAILDLVD